MIPSWHILLFLLWIPLSQAIGKYYYTKSNATVSSIPDAFEGTASVFFPMHEYKEQGISCWKVIDCRPDAIQRMKNALKSSADVVRTGTWIFCFGVFLATLLGVIGVYNFDTDDAWWPPCCCAVSIVALFFGVVIFIIILSSAETQNPLLDFCYANFNYAQIVQV